MRSILAICGLVVLACTEHPRPAPPSPAPFATAASADATLQASVDAASAPNPCEVLFADFDAEAKRAMLAKCKSAADCACMQAVAAPYGSPHNCAAAFHASGIERTHVPTLRALEAKLRAVPCRVERCSAVPCEPQCISGACENAKQLPGP